MISIRGGGTGFPISVMIEGITVIGSLEDYLPSSAGVQAIGMSQVIMRDCHVSEVLTGVELLDNAQAMLIRVTISGGERNLGGTGIDLLARSQAIVVDSKITWFGDGIAARMWAQIMVLHSTIKHARFGIHITEDAQAIMRDVLISNTDDGIIITERAQARIANCTLVDNGIGVGIFHYGSVTLLENVIARNRYYGVLVSLHNPRVWFRGFVMGANNAIPGPDEPNGNGYGAVFPEALGFLTTQIGGVFHKGT
ncbi:MAG: right-handed parallel beta-helix repeat-containing protein [Candidatus Bipolaricaulaceae bacterium]